MKYVERIFATATGVFRELKLSVKITLVAVVVVFFMGTSIVITGQPGFCNSCHVMNPFYDSWQSSEHSNVSCLDCHLQPGFRGYVKGKINGLAQAVDCMVGRIGTKPSATVEDVSCLRSECHSTQELGSTEVDFHGTKFTHEKHIVQTVDGITISCGTCHSHFEGDEHFTINTMVCFTCHFLKGSQNGERLVETGCQDCHEVPDSVIERGFVKINHADFVSYEASCDDSCHKKEIEKESDVADNVCLSCHSFSMEAQADSSELHEVHTHGDKVECFACHGEISHGQTQVASVWSMMDCQNCHSETHQVQRTIYAGEYDVHDSKAERVLSPMFLTHVECIGCHIEPTPKKYRILDSLGIVAKAAPRACDKCHEQGTGEQYIPFWQKKIKELHEKIGYKVDKLQRRAQLETDEQLAEQLHEKVKQARSILESVASDGSWGVHNFKYTESMLLRADEIVDR